MKIRVEFARMIKPFAGEIWADKETKKKTYIIIIDNNHSKMELLAVNIKTMTTIYRGDVQIMKYLTYLGVLTDVNYEGSFLDENNNNQQEFE